MTMTITPFNIREPYALQIVNGKLSFNRTFDDTYWTRTRIDSRSTDGHRWMKNAFLFNFPSKGCSVFREQAPDWYRVLLGDVITSGKECTVPPGVYPIEKQSVNWTFPNVPIMPYGFMRFHSTFGRARETDFCFQAEFHSIPRPKPGNIG
ncbi:uncharacterized protein LOC113205224 isoform X2 [Frankliniella occidentalis]|nr:uncharacterized protein LOC113205224 isoform X2 [Frankliniella occidentalis]